MKAIRMGSSLRIAVAVSAALAMTACLGACLAPAASARPDPLIAFPADKQQGESAGRFGIAPFAIASSPVTGEVYVVDLGNHRINVFTAWGQFIRAFGWNVDASDPAEELQTCTPETGCKKGSSGSGLGQIGEIVGGGITVDPMGNVYVGDLWASRRIQKFSSTGEFLLAFGGSGTGDGEFSTFGTPATSIGTSPDGESVYVGDRNRIQEFGSDGSFKSEITFKSLHEQMSVFPETGQILALVADPNDGELHISVSKEVSSEAALPYVFTVDPDSGKLLGEYDSGDLIGQQGPEMGAPKLIAVDSDENLYVFNAAGGSGSGLPQLFKFDPVGNLLIPNQGEQEAIKKENEEINKGFHENPFSRFPDSSATTPLVWGIGTNGGCGTEEDILYIGRGGGSFAYVEAYGPPPQDTVKCPPPPPGVPEVGSQYATSVGTDSAVLGAEINPRYAL
ncbi:MAG TPA: hypothetical protein VJQ84_01500, partial [Solirubrobacterales bacterium]|nr:hypothetical protein [Solirubrobacterales bacterium]